MTRTVSWWCRSRTRRRVIALAQDIEVAEDRIREAVESGMRLDEARRQFKYFELQRKKESGS